MATYSVSEIQELTSVRFVSSWVPDKVKKYISMAENAIDNLEMDTTISGYSTAYTNAVLLMFDFLAENPTGKVKSRLGKSSIEYAQSLPMSIQNIVSKFVTGTEGGFFAGAQMSRNDIGTR